MPSAYAAKRNCRLLMAKALAARNTDSDMFDSGLCADANEGIQAQGMERPCSAHNAAPSYGGAILNALHFPSPAAFAGHLASNLFHPPWAPPPKPYPPNGSADNATYQSTKLK